MSAEFEDVFPEFELTRFDEAKFAGRLLLHLLSRVVLPAVGAVLLAPQVQDIMVSGLLDPTAPYFYAIQPILSPAAAVSTFGLVLYLQQSLIGE